MEPVIFFAAPPNLDDLCGLTVNVTTSTQTNSTLMQPHIIKCREMIFTEPEILASPSYDLDSCFHMILRQTTYKTGRIQARLQKQRLGISKPYRVHPVVYQSCLRYTVMAKLAPMWNRCGEWFIQGRDFLSHAGYTNAIKMTLNASRDELFISLTGTAVKFPPLQIEDLNLSKQEMAEILQTTEGKLREVDIADSWCHVLPSMKRGKICSLSLTIPSESPFSSYKDLKRHWKNMYGYRLSETDEDLLYCQISFLPSGAGKHFTYPSICLRAGPVQVVQRVDPKPILTAFLQDIHSKVSTVCGQPLRFQPKIRYPVLSLHSAEEVAEHVNLSVKSIYHSGAPLRSVDSIAHLYRADQHDQRYHWKDKLNKDILRSTAGNDLTLTVPDRWSSNTDSQHSTPALNKNSCDVPTDTCSGGPVLDSRTCPLDSETDSVFARHSNSVTPVAGSSAVKSISTSGQDLKSHLQSCNNPVSKSCHYDDSVHDNENTYSQKWIPSSVSIGHSSSAPAVTPSSIIRNMAASGQMSSQQNLRSLQANHDQNELTGEVANAETKYIPFFRPKLKASVSKLMPTQQHRGQNITASGTLVPVFKPKVAKSAMALGKRNERKPKSSTKTNEKCVPSEVASVESSSGSNDQSPVECPMLATCPSHLSGPGQIFTPQAKAVRKPSTLAVSQFHKVDVQPTGKKIASKEHIFTSNCQMTPLQPAVFPAVTTGKKNPHRMGEVAMSKMKPPGTPDLSQRSFANSDNSSVFEAPNAGLKRKSNNQSEVSTAKTRAKPQLQSLDVEVLATVGQLNKVNTVTLLAWLKERGVTCRTKDKKSDLVDKVKKHLGTSGSEP